MISEELKPTHFCRGISGRIVASIWWFVTMIIYASYTANLVSFLTVEKPFSLVEGIDDLIHPKPGVRYGAKANGSTYFFFRDADNANYNAMFEKMAEDRNIPKSNEEGIQLVQKYKYAYLMESSTIEYNIERICDVVQVGKPLDEKGYGIAMKKSILKKISKKIFMIIIFYDFRFAFSRSFECRNFTTTRKR